MADFRWKKLHALLCKAGYDASYQPGSGAVGSTSEVAAIWDDKAKDWRMPQKLNCITSANFFLAFLLLKGGKGYDPGVSGSNLVKAAAGVKRFSDHFKDLGLGFPAPQGSQNVLSALARDDSRYSQTDRWPWWEMPLGLAKQARCKCGLHVSPALVLANKHKLARVNIASVSLCSGKPVSRATRLYRQLQGTDKTIPYEDYEAYPEYTVMLVFHVDGDLYVYHHLPEKGSRWRPLREQAEAYVDEGTREGKHQDSLWIVWSLPDSTWESANPHFFKDDDLKSEWRPAACNE